MASIGSFHRLVPHDDILHPSLHSTTAPALPAIASRVSVSVSRRDALILSIVPLNLAAFPSPSHSRERRGRKNIPLEDYITTTDGLKYYDLIVGKGPQAERGSTVQVHFDCVFRGITAVSSRESKLLAGNRSIAQFPVFRYWIVRSDGASLIPRSRRSDGTKRKERKREYVDSANGLYSAQAAPKPPPALYTITEGMREGGKRVVIVPPEVGYGKRGMNEIPPDSTFELNVELLQIVSPAGK